MSSSSIPDACSSDLLLVLNFESWSRKCSRTDRFETLNFGSLMLLSFPAIFPQTFLSQLFEVCSGTVGSTRSPCIKLHCVSRTSPWCLTCMTTNFYLSERPNVLNKCYNFQVQSRFIFYTLDSDLSDDCKKRGYYDKKKKKIGHDGNFALRASENVVNFFSLEGRTTKQKLSMWSEVNTIGKSKDLLSKLCVLNG